MIEKFFIFNFRKIKKFNSYFKKLFYFSHLFATKEVINKAFDEYSRNYREKEFNTLNFIN